MFTRPSLIAAVVIAICICATTFSVAENDAPQDEQAILGLMTQKRDTLRSRFDAMSQKYEDGTMALDAVLDAQGDLLEAELSLAFSSADRVDVRKSQVENMKKMESHFRQRFESGTAAREEVLSAKAERLEAEIALLREKARQ